MNTNRHRLAIGTTARGALFTLDTDARRRHLYIVGQTGSGKSTLLLNCIAQDLAAGHGLALLDPHGELAEQMLSAIPPHRAHHLVYFNPGDLARPLGFNVLARVPPDSRATVADGVVAAFKHVWPEFWGPRLEYILLNAVRLLLDAPGSTLLGLPRLLIDGRYRQRLLAHCRDPVVVRFWRSEFDGYDTRFRNEAIAPIQNKVGRLLSSPHLRNVLAQPTSSFNLRRTMDEERILVVNLSKGLLGEGTAHLLGALLVTAIAQAALSRADMPEHQRRVFHLYADEFQSYASDSFGVILSEARKYGLALVLAHQFTAQIPLPLRQAVLGNAGSIIAFRVGADDAPLLADHLGIPNDAMVKDLRNFSGLGKFLIDGHPSDPIHLDLPPPPRAINSHPERLITNSRIRFGRDRHSIEARIQRFLAS